MSAYDSSWAALSLRRVRKIAQRGETLTRWRQRMGEEKMNEHCNI
jgi:hypothetical protein